MTSQKLDLTKSVAKLEELASVLRGAGRRRVLLLCHNNPDPDSIASAFGFRFLLSKRFGVRSILGYGGVVTRAENKAMIQRLRIKLQQFSHIEPSKFYATALIDAQPGTGNSLMGQRGEPPTIVIDHHPLRRLSQKAAFHDVRPHYGATSTIITEYLVASELTPTRSVANALLYGIKTDTNTLGSGATKTDFNAFLYLSSYANPRVVGWIEKPPLPREFFEDYVKGLSSTLIFRDAAVSSLGKIRSSAIIPELADLLLRVHGVSWSLCMGENKNLLILSLRSTSHTYRAGVVLRKLLGRAGSAGGHKEMAGGQVPLSGLTRTEKDALPTNLISKFLKLIDREHCTPKLMVESNESQCMEKGGLTNAAPPSNRQ
jgi:nanoRNase/pAp phosphatase (c-di-AMP/oligoRNAs hydrolase)